METDAKLKDVPIKEGTILRYPIHDENGLLLVKSGTSVNAKLLGLLTRRGVQLNVYCTLEVLKGPQVGMEIPIKEGMLKVGRGEGNHIRPRSNQVSKYHCKLVKLKHGLYLKDLESTNGSFVNEERVKDAVELKDGDEIRFGETHLKVHIYAALEGDSVVKKEVAGLIIADEEGETSEPEAGVTQPRMDKKVLEEFHRLMAGLGDSKKEISTNG